MISKQIEIVSYMTCKCGNHPRLTETRTGKGPLYHMESMCCGTVTVKLRSAQRAKNEYQRIRATQSHDETTDPLLDGANRNVTVLKGARS